ncbi:MAG: hypothetical protein KZQ65_09755, partial [Candidatus Thiodiazotropha sp. (ex Gloverina cf. vestifex)]|nr:hypothetical protein [Candidatus Thiodiazotropha sp. (ex Gloverina cf. vestifex)]
MAATTRTTSIPKSQPSTLKILPITSSLFVFHAWCCTIPTYQACRYLVKDFGTSESPKSTRQRDSRYAPT